MNSLTNQNYIVYPTKFPWQQMPCVSLCRAMPCLILQEQVTSLMATVMPHAPLPFLLLSTVYAAWLNMTFLSIRYNQYFTTVKRKGKSHVNLRVTAFLGLSLVFSVVWRSSEHVTPPSPPPSLDKILFHRRVTQAACCPDTFIHLCGKSRCGVKFIFERNKWVKTTVEDRLKPPTFRSDCLQRANQ